MAAEICEVSAWSPVEGIEMIGCESVNDSRLHERKSLQEYSLQEHKSISM